MKEQKERESLQDWTSETLNKKVKEIGYPDPLVTLSGAGRADTDQRVTCDPCQHRTVVEADEFIAIDKARQIRLMGRRVGMAGDKFEQRGNWLRIYWDEPQCKITKIMPMPDGVLHHCHFANVSETQKEESWWE